MMGGEDMGFHGGHVPLACLVSSCLDAFCTIQCSINLGVNVVAAAAAVFVGNRGLQMVLIYAFFPLLLSFRPYHYHFLPLQLPPSLIIIGSRLSWVTPLSTSSFPRWIPPPSSCT